MVNKGGLEPQRVLSHQILNLDNKRSKTIQNYEKQADDTDSCDPDNPNTKVGFQVNLAV